MTAVSVVIPTFNCGAFLAVALRSVLAQTFSDVEILVVDDGSTDDTAERLRPFRERIHFAQQDRLGPAAARNRGILNARGRYIAFLDADDLWLPDKLFRQVALLDRQPHVVLSYTDYRRGPSPETDGAAQLESYAYRASGDVFPNLFRQNFIHTSTVLVRRDALACSGLFDPSLRGSEDLELWLRLARTGPFACVAEVLAGVRRHENNTTRTLEYARHRVRATRMMWERWGEEGVAPLIRRRLGQCWWDLAYAEKARGNYREARRAFWHSARYGHRRAAALLRALLWWPHFKASRGVCLPRVDMTQA
jgi:glycosyltransferase involved in cell wall biosynthesis